MVTLLNMCHSVCSLEITDNWYVDTVHHEIDSVVCSHRVSVWLPVIGLQLVLEKEPASQIT